LPITELNSQEFAKNLAQQSMGVVPNEFTNEQKEYIAQKVYEFCVITGDHLLKQYKEQFSDEQSTIIIQFIGEWTFHKAIDLVRVDVDKQHWDQILQQVAFAALKAALHANVEKFDDQKTAVFIEHNVKRAYEECINQLVKADAIPEDKKEKILSESNVDKMAQEANDNEASFSDDEKTIKYVAIAMIFKKMPQQKVEKILEKMDENERQKIQSCLDIKDLEQKLDASLINKYILDLKRNISLKSKPDTNELLNSFKILQAEYGEEEIINLTIFERSKIQRILSFCLFESNSNTFNVELSSYIIKILYNYLKNKLAAVNV